LPEPKNKNIGVQQVTFEMSWKNSRVEILKNSNGMNTMLKEPLTQNLIPMKLKEILVV